MTAIDTTETEHFLRALGGHFTFQTFGEGEARARGRDPLAKWMHGSLAEHADKLADLNARGAGVFVMVNEGDGEGRASRNVQRIRAYFADFDGTQPPGVTTVPLAPHAIVESSPGRWHWYWFIEGARLESFKAVQVAIAERFRSDSKVNDLPRVMRLPGFMHRKAEPFRTRIVELREAPRYTHADFVQAFGIDFQPASARDATVIRLPNAQQRKRTLSTIIAEGERNATLLSLAAGLVHKGHDLLAINRRLQKINAERCKPPLCAAEVDNIAMRAIGYGSEGYRLLTDPLFDDLVRSGLPLPVRWIVLTALRRFDGFNNGNIALTHEDCLDIQGCRDEKSFFAKRLRAVDAGFLIVAKQPIMTRNGKTPTLFAIPPRYLVSLTGQNTPLAHTGANTPSYIDKQAYGTAAVAGGLDTRLQARAQTSRQGAKR